MTNWVNSHCGQNYLVKCHNLQWKMYFVSSVFGNIDNVYKKTEMRKFSVRKKKLLKMAQNKSLLLL